MNEADYRERRKTVRRALLMVMVICLFGLLTTTYLIIRMDAVVGENAALREENAALRDQVEQLRRHPGAAK